MNNTMSLWAQDIMSLVIVATNILHKNNDSVCNTKKAPRLQCGMQSPLTKVKDRCKKADVIELAVIHNNRTVVV